MKTLSRFVPVAFASLTLLFVGCSPEPAGDGRTEELPTVVPEVDEGPSLYEQLLEVATVEEMVMVPMRDGVRLATHVYRPKGSESNPVPTIFVKTPYNMNLWGDGEMNMGRFRGPLEAVRRGYAYVNQNERGKFYSEGEWDILGPPKTDGYDALSWIAAQPWSNGKVGTQGCSSTAEWQMGLAALDHPAHAAMVPQGFGAGVGRIGEWYEQGNWYRGGAEQMLFFTWLYGVQNTQRPQFDPNLDDDDRARVARYFDLAPELPRVDWTEALWHLPVEDLMRHVGGPEGIFADPAPVATGGEMIQRAPNDPAWYRGGLYHDDEPFGVPSFWFMSWYDVSIGPNLALFNHVRENGVDEETRENQFAMVAPVTHCGYTRARENTVVGERSVGDARWEYSDLIFDWFDHWLKGEDNGITETLPKVRYYTMGSNEWNTSATWPPEDAQMVTFYLESGGSANTLSGDGRLVPEPPSADNVDSFTYDPMDPVMSYGGNVCCIGGAIDAGSFDQQEIESSRQDILVYTTDPLEEGVEVSGTIGITLYVSSDARDTDFTVKLLDVYPDGSAYNLDETIQRARYREGYTQQVFMEEGQVHELEVSPMSTSNYFEVGHSLRIEVSSSNFPRFTRNLNTGGNNYDETEGVVAHNQVHHSAEYPSQIRIPIVRR
ncbi:MAG: CocE/NonD family hydrolase [Gemmatimonadetes bacterium]|nr:CocE/NonD family hydrolase [Gemmatimonadota bacterium]NNM06421.1 CocE/NonD family hydrolase [Gemmatimonadota bacterium]